MTGADRIGDAGDGFNKALYVGPQAQSIDGCGDTGGDNNHNTCYWRENGGNLENKKHVARFNAMQFVLQQTRMHECKDK